jgi:hypothetical protein
LDRQSVLVFRGSAIDSNFDLGHSDLKSATLRWWQAIDRGAVHVGEIDHFLSELDWDQDLIRFGTAKPGLGREMDR